MSILGGRSSSMDTSSSFGELKKQASFFFKEKFKTARLALTDVTPAQLLAEEVTGGNQWGPDTKTMKLIVKAAFEVDDYCRIVSILHKRLSSFDKHHWRVSYNSLILLEHLLTHGPKSAAEEFQIDKDVIFEMQTFQCTDDKGFNWGLAVSKKAEVVLSLLGNPPLLKQERVRARTLTRGIQGFGSFGERQQPDRHGIMLKQSSSFGASGSSDNKPLSSFGHAAQRKQGEMNYNLDCLRQAESHGTWETEKNCRKENTAAPGCVDVPANFKRKEESTKPLLLDEQKGEPEQAHHHPFNHVEAQEIFASLLSTKF
uniref:ENTH domain-containing protein n=1 Tax=Kalanchoe fedtschenkoi TaxID=63787 RepID=A0A7N0U075_KALFE